jgi:hypothetical protein
MRKPAYQAMGDNVNKKADLTSWYTPHPTHIIQYNIKNLNEQWKKAVETRLEAAMNIAQRIKPGCSLYRHRIGSGRPVHAARRYAALSRFGYPITGMGYSCCGWSLKFKKKLLLPNRPQGAGMLHFNGGGTSKDAYFNSHAHFKGDPIWGLARYYVDLPLTWARVQIKSQLKEGQEGYQIKVTHLVPNRTDAYR